MLSSTVVNQGCCSNAMPPAADSANRPCFVERKRGPFWRFTEMLARCVEAVLSERCAAPVVAACEAQALLVRVPKFADASLGALEEILRKCDSDCDYVHSDRSTDEATLAAVVGKVVDDATKATQRGDEPALERAAAVLRWLLARRGFHDAAVSKAASKGLLARLTAEDKWSALAAADLLRRACTAESENS